MKSIKLFIPLFFIPFLTISQNIEGIWQGVLYQPNGVITYYPFLMNLNQAGNDIQGHSEIETPETIANFYGKMYLIGSVDNSVFTFQELEILEETTDGIFRWCIKNGELIYDPDNNTLIGPWEELDPGCPPGIIELGKLSIASDTIFCINDDVELIANGQNVKWYKDSSLDTLLWYGSNFSPSISETTTFYITQTILNTETLPIAINAVISDPNIQSIFTTIENCESSDGSIEISANGGIGQLQYSINQSPFTAQNIYSNLEGGNYDIRIRDNVGCVDQQDAIIESTINPVIQISGNTEICMNDNSTLVAAGGISYNWSSEETTSQIEVSTEGDYIVTVTNSDGCTDSESIFVTVYDLPEVTLEFVEDEFCIDETEIELVGGNPLNGTYSGIAVNGNSFNPNQAGEGSHIITYAYTDENGCSNSVSSVVSVSNDYCTTSTNNPNLESNIKIYPNPSEGNINIEFREGDNEYRISIFNLQGRIIFDKSSRKEQLVISNLDSGVYILTIESQDMIVNRKLIIN